MKAADTPHTAIVTGAASGFGAVAARALHQAGHRIIVSDINGDAARRLTKDRT